MDERLKDLIAGAVLIGMLGLNTFLQLNSTTLVRFVVLFGVLYHAWMLGRRLIPRTSSLAQTLAGGVFFFSIFSVGLTAWFYTGGSLTALPEIWILGATMVVAQILNITVRDIDEVWIETKEAWVLPRLLQALLLLLAASGGLIFVLVNAARAATTTSIRSPWPLLPHGILAAVAVCWVAIPLTAWLVRSRWLTGLHTSIALFATTSIAPLLYRIGFGFDGFLHLAGERQILATGTLNPKPLYYMGQYVFTTWLARILDLPIESVDRWLVPFGVALLLALTAAILAREHTKATPLILVLIPLSPFIATTPQAFAYALGVSSILLALCTRDTVAWPAPLLLAAWSIATHPLAGVPLALIATSLLLVREDAVRWRHIARNSLAVIGVIGAGIAIPLLFFVFSLNGNTPIIWNIGSLFSVQPWIDFFASISPWIGNRFVVWPAFASLVTQATPVLALAGWIWGLTRLPKNKRAPFAVLGASGIVLFLSGVALKTTGNFAFLIDYERGNYAERLFILGTFCLVLAALPALTHALERARKQPSFFSFALLATIAFLAAAQTYNAFPRNDALVTGRGWSVSQADVDAVKSIDRDATDQPYTVLADQSVSAAAISELGFKRYNGDIFFYPIPTGGQLYDVFLRMTYQEPSRNTAHDAAQLGNSKIVYVVLNDYWWNAASVGQSLESISDAHWGIGPDGGPLGTTAQVYKFTF